MKRTTFLKIAGSALASLFASKATSAPTEFQNVKQENEPLKFTLKPYIVSLTNTNAFIVFATNKTSVAEVKVVYPNNKVKRFYSSEHTSGIKHAGTLHQVYLYGLKAGEEFKFSVRATEVVSRWDFSQKDAKNRFKFGSRIKFEGNNGEYLPLKVPHESNKVEFGVINDIHADVKRMKTHLSSMGNIEHIIINGDMDNYLRTHNGILSRYLAELSNFAKCQIPIYYSRGNHECWGEYAENFSKYAPNGKGKTYYAFRKGPIFFLILDSCDNDYIHQSTGNGGDFERWQIEEIEWLKEVIASDEYKKAPFRVAFQHVPFYTKEMVKQRIRHASFNSFSVMKRKRFYEAVLKDANLDLLCCGHTHQHFFSNNAEDLSFPMIVNAREGMKITADNSKIEVEFIDEKGKIIRDKITIRAKA